MKVFLAATLLFGVTTAPVPTQPTSSWLYILGAVFAGGVITTLYQVYLRWRRGPLEDKELIGRITSTANSDMKNILDEYRLEVEVVKRQVEDYRVQLHSLTKELAGATLRISQLEVKLESSEGDKEKLRKELEAAQKERTRLEIELEQLREEIKKQVGQFTGTQ